MRNPCAVPSLGTVAVPQRAHRRGQTPPRRARQVAPRASRVDVADTVVRTQHVVCLSFDSVVDATAEMTLVGFEAARRFWPGKIPGDAEDYADVFAMLAPCLEETSSFEAALMVRVLAEENLAERTRFRFQLRERKRARLAMEARENARMERATTTKGREKLREVAAERAEALKKRRREYALESERLRAGRSTRPLNLREVVAGWDEIKLAASVKFGVELETNVGWEGRTVQPAGLQAVVDEVRYRFSVGDIQLSVDDTANVLDANDADADAAADADADDADAKAKATTSFIEEAAERVSEENVAELPKRRWLRSHALHHGAREFTERCLERGHEVIILGGPGRTAEQCREVLAHLGVCVAASDGGVDARATHLGDASARARDACLVVGTEYGTARGLAVAALMHDRERPRQRWHLVDASLAELTRITASGLEETSAFTSRFASWTPALHADKVRAELRDGVKFVDHRGLFELVGITAPPSVMDSR